MTAQTAAFHGPICQASHPCFKLLYLLHIKSLAASPNNDLAETRTASLNKFQNSLQMKHLLIYESITQYSPMSISIIMIHVASRFPSLIGS